MDFRTVLSDKALLYATVLLATGVVLWLFFDLRMQNDPYFTDNIKSNISRELKILEQDLDKVGNRITDNPEPRFLTLRVPTKYPYYVFNDRALTYWSDNKVVPGYNSLKGDYRYKLVDLEEGQYIAFKKVVKKGEQQLELYGLIPIYFRSKISNQYLQSRFNSEIFSDPDIKIYTTQGVGNDVMVDEGPYLFSVSFGREYQLQNHPLQYLVLAILMAGIVYLLIWINGILKWFVNGGNVLGGFLFFIISLVVIRSIMLWLSFPFGVIGFDIFNSRYFASSNINPSLGDLFLNVLVLLAWVNFLFQYYFRSKIYRQLISLRGTDKIIISFSLIFGSFFLLLGVYELMMNMQKHAQWSIDINENVNFSTPLKWISLLIFFMGAVGYFTLSHIVFRTYIKLNQPDSKNILGQMAVAALLFMALSLFIEWPFILLAVVHGLYFLVVYKLFLTRYLVKISYLTFIYFFVCAIACSTVGTYTIYKFSKIKNLSEKQNIAAQLLAEKDFLGEYLINEAVQKIKDDIFIGITFSNLFSDKESVRQKIRRRHLNNYLDRYDIDIYLFDQRGVPIENDRYIENYYQFRERYSVRQLATEYENIYLVNSFETDLEKGYVVFVPIYYERFRSNVGHIILSLKLKRVIPNSVYPELLVDQNQSAATIERDYSYALFKDGELEYTSGLFNASNDFELTDLQKDKLYETGVAHRKMFYLGVRGDDNKTIVISSEAYPFKDILANFSFLFLLLVFVILLVIVFYAIKFEFKGTNLNLAAKIQLYLNFAFFLPLFAVSITTLSLLNSSYKDQLKNEYYAKAENLSGNISSLLESYFTNQTSKETLSNKLVEIAKFAECDLNLFNVNGRLIASTQPLIYENGLLSQYVHPVAIEAVIENGDRLLLDESVGSLEFKNTYYGIKSFETGTVISILSIPFFESESERDQQIIEVLSNIMVTFTFIFIIFLALSYFASRFLTSPLRYIRQKLKKISLSDTNTPMVWNSDDEIGLLVGEYNKMLVNLEESKKALARSEKESAWREMAQQVAHEIKNPLTPMKLNLQHLKRTLENNGSENDGYTNKSINNLLHQIETLNDIATSFSAFAKMPIPKNERLELTGVVKSAANLHANDQAIRLMTQLEKGPIYVMGDEKLFGRIINNLIINGIQAVPPERTPEIVVKLIKINKKVVIEVQDNGLGISEDIAKKVFIPNFSTKESGSGIGLAIAKRGIEQTGGSIWFETDMNKGTSFFIELPMVD
ncbi:MAG: HAMP domain-containing histidine kinase [Cytophagales bacterium]|nr:HAMP domain-containing histidine kinase [Cytophagales bacterium]